jgi:hypothetical protein
MLELISKTSDKVIASEAKQSDSSIWPEMRDCFGRNRLAMARLLSSRWPILILISFLFFSPVARAWEKPEDQKALGKTVTQQHYTYFTINNIFSQYANNLIGAVEMLSGQASGFEWPKGSNKQVVYQDGFIYGGYYKGRNILGVPANRKFVNGSYYISGMTEGSITQYGTGIEPVDAQYQNPSDPSVRVYRVRTDMNPYDSNTTLVAKIAVLQSEEVPLIKRYKSAVTAQALYDQYKKDWDEWPANKGAPFEDIDGNGIYDPLVDIPGIPEADQTMWMVCNDMNFLRSQSLAGSDPDGIEIQRTIWGYKRSNDFGNMLFMRYRLLNKSGALIDSMFVALWSDVEVGFAGDDYVGCDTVRSLGYCYNGRSPDQVYGDAPPSVGYVLLQGPGVPGLPTDSAVIDFRYVKQKKNLKLSSFDMFIGGGAMYTDPRQGNSTAGRDQWWNLLNGRISYTGGAWVTPSGDTTKFPLSGDPVTGVGWIDGSFAPPGDRRLVLTCGPITMQPSDTQEVVYAAVVGQGADRLSSITALRATCDELNSIYVQPFGFPKPPPLPHVIVTPLDNAILLSWGDPVSVKAIEQDYYSKGYKFEGYKVYQAEDIYLKNSKVIGTFDIPNDPFLNNTGIVHYVKITNDAIKSGALVNGRSYYFAVSSVAYTLSVYPNLLEQVPVVVEAIPQSPPLGSTYNNQHLDKITVNRLTGIGAATVEVRVIDPTKTVSASYVVQFDTLVGNIPVWNLTRDGIAVMANVTSNVSMGPALPIVDGLQASASGWSMSAPVSIAGTKRVYPAYGNSVKDGKSLLRHTTGHWLSHCGLDAQALALPANKTEWDLEFRFTGVPASYLYLKNQDTTIISGGQWATYWPRAADSVTNLTGVPHINIRMPFELWDIENNKQINFAVVDRDLDGKSRWGDAGNWALSGNTAWFRTPGREYIVPIYSQYNASSAATTTFSPLDPNATWLLVLNYDWTTNDIFDVLITNPVVPGDMFGFDVTGPTTGDINLAKAQSRQINAFPNPFFGPQPLGTNGIASGITFSHLPQRAIIRIYTLAGYLVKSFDKDDSSQFLFWDLRNSDGIQVASGVYVVHVEMPGLGISRILKLSIIQPAYAPPRL